MNLDLRVPLFIVGAGRSGTNLMGRLLDQDPRFWNSYENRYIWNYRQRTLAHDVRRPEEATPRVQKFIRGYFARLAERTGCVIVDKTPSNIFRVGFVRAVFPQSKIIHIIRDGRDNVLSRRIEWYGGRAVAAERDAGRTGRYRLAFLRRRLEHLSVLLRRGNLPVARWPTFLRDNAVPFLSNLVGGEPLRWGERFPGMKQCLDAYGLLTTSAIQWRTGVMHALCEGRRLPREAYLEIKYEDLLSAPDEEWQRIGAFLGMGTDSPAHDWLMNHARRENFGKWRSEMPTEVLLALEPHIRPTLEFLGYSWK